MTDNATAVRLYDAEGTQVDSHDASAAAPQAGTASARLELRNGTVTFAIEVEVNPNTHPFVITGGTIGGAICGAPWRLTGGHIGDDIRLDATREGSGSCAETITIVGEQAVPSSWRGTYGFNGAATSFKQTTLFRGWA